MGEQISPGVQAEILQPSNNINDDVDFFIKLGFKLLSIYPADNPVVASLSEFGVQIRLDKNTQCPPSTIILITDNFDQFNHQQGVIKAPNGTVFNLAPRTTKLNSPPTQHKFEVRRLKDNDPWVIGRAGMLYRDLIPDRLGGSIIASHINIPKGGPVPDMVHYHAVGFQLIFCYKGWVKVVYEDQGAPILLNAGDCVTQPPEIRHRVLESSDNLEVIEIGVPAEHMTTIDHDMDLPTKTFKPNRKFQGQTFCHHQKEEANWLEGPIPGFEFRDTGINQASNNVASVIVSKPINSDFSSIGLTHNSDISFTFILEGAVMLTADNSSHNLKSGDAFVLPPEMNFSFSECSSDLQLLQVMLPGSSKITAG